MRPSKSVAFLLHIVKTVRVYKISVSQPTALLATVHLLGWVWFSHSFRIVAAAAFIFQPLQIVEVSIMPPLLFEPPRVSKAAALLLHRASVALLVHCAAAVSGFDLCHHASIYSSSA